MLKFARGFYIFNMTENLLKIVRRIELSITTGFLQLYRPLFQETDRKNVEISFRVSCHCLTNIIGSFVRKSGFLRFCLCIVDNY